MHKLHFALLLATSFCFSQTLSIESGNHGTGGTSAAAYNIPGQDATSTQGGQGANGGQGGNRAFSSNSPTSAEFPGGGGGGGRSTSNVQASAGTPGRGRQVKIYF